MEQGSTEWLEWRKKGIGASDTPIIMGVSPYKSPFMLWQEKLGLVTDEIDESKAMIFAKGHEWEPKIRQMVEDKLNLKFNVGTYIKANKDHIRASLDGINLDTETILEIKYANMVDHDLAKDGIVPEKYMAQMQHQLLVTDFNKAIYASYNEKQDDLQLVTVARDQKKIEQIEKAVDEFWNVNIKQKIAPELTDMDYVEVKDFAIEEAVLQYKKLSNEIKDIEKKLNELKKEITDKMPHVACKVLDHKVYKVSRKGSVNYLAIPEIKGVDLEQYRGNAVEYWTIK